ncbi:hypothetical protein C2E23DRAFT_889915 [Lenzites betulinus]|nr:hypothetical protein C2E23DRAFT_889915 [Lenzites betulinus]
MYKDSSLRALNIQFVFTLRNPPESDWFFAALAHLRSPSASRPRCLVPLAPTPLYLCLSYLRSLHLVFYFPSSSTRSTDVLALAFDADQAVSTSTGQFQLRPASWSDNDSSNSFATPDASISSDSDSEYQAAIDTVRRLQGATRPTASTAAPHPSEDYEFVSFLPIFEQLLALKMTQPYRLPPRGATAAPSFDPINPQTLLDFFEDLEYMLEEAAVEEDEKRKGHAVRYAPTTEKSLWRTLDGYTTGTYDTFKQSVIREYLGEGGKRLYSPGDLRALVTDAAHGGCRSTSDFKLYSRKFRVMADYLVAHDALRKDERERLFLRGIPDVLQQPVLDRLKYKAPDVLAPRIPYSVEQVTEAAEFVLDSQDEDGPSFSTAAPTTVKRPAADSVSPHVKTETTQLADALTAMAQAMSLLQRQPPAPSTSMLRQPPPHLDPKADTSAKLVKRNEQGQVVLHSGSYVPGSITGNTIRERIHEYYSQHPEARASPPPAQMLFEPVYRTMPPAASQAVIQYLAADAYERPAHTSTRGIIHGLAHDETGGAFAQLEQEIFAADRRKAASPKPDSRPQESREDRARRRMVRFDEPDDRAIRVPPPVATIEELPDEPTISSVKAPSTAAERAHVTAPASTPANAPEHPFRNIRDATYAPPTQRNFGLPPDKATPATRKPEGAYKSQVPVYDPRHAANVFKRCLEAPISLTHEELLALAPEIRHATREACSTRRVPVEDTSTPKTATTQSRTAAFLADMPDTYETAVHQFALHQTSTPPPGAIVIQDPVENYLRTQPHCDHRPLLKVSVESLAIRAIEGSFPQNTRVSCILDSGSSIVSMSEGLCHALGLAFDPTIILEMQSANGDVSPSLGLARNVPVLFGSIVAYLQFHVVRSPAYDVILTI